MDDQRILDKIDSMFKDMSEKQDVYAKDMGVKYDNILEALRDVEAKEQVTAEKLANTIEDNKELKAELKELKQHLKEEYVTRLELQPISNMAKPIMIALVLAVCSFFFTAFTDMWKNTNNLVRSEPYASESKNTDK